MKKVLCVAEALIDFVSNKPGASLKDSNFSQPIDITLQIVLNFFIKPIF